MLVAPMCIAVNFLTEKLSEKYFIVNMNQYCKTSEVVDRLLYRIFVDKKSVSGNIVGFLLYFFICFYRVQTDSLILNNIQIKFDVFA